MSDSLTDLEAAYYADLERFVELCHSLTAAGQRYMTVLLCHELYRFLYPSDPYAGFTHRDPVPFLTAHLEPLDCARDGRARRRARLSRTGEQARSERGRRPDGRRKSRRERDFRSLFGSVARL